MPDPSSAKEEEEAMQIHLNCRNKIFAIITYHHSHFLAVTLDFISLFTIAFLRAALFFYSLAILD